MLRNGVSFLCSSLLLVMLVLGCSSRRGVEKVKLVRLPFQLTQVLDGEKIPVSFGKVKAIDVDSQGNLYVLDAENCRVSKFDVEGRLIDYWGKEGLGPVEFQHPRALFVVGDSLLYVFHDGGAEVMDLGGSFRRSVLANEIYDVKVCSEGKIVYNYQDRSLSIGFCLSVYTPDSKVIADFREPLARKYKNEVADVGFMDLNSRDEIVYFQAFLDSIYIYDLHGKVLARARQNLGFRPKLLTKDHQVALNEDVFVDRDDQIFVLRVFKEASEEGTLTKTIDEYEPNLKLIRTYELPEPVTLSIGFNLVSPWYHKFAKRGRQFLFFVSEPEDHLEVYVPQQ